MILNLVQIFFEIFFHLFDAYYLTSLVINVDIYLKFFDRLTIFL